jgi:hypothetical protein
MHCDPGGTIWLHLLETILELAASINATSSEGVLEPIRAFFPSIPSAYPPEAG